MTTFQTNPELGQPGGRGNGNGGNGGSDTPPFDAHLRDVARRVRRALSEVLSAIGADPTRPQSVARQLGLDKNLAWKTSKIVSDDDLFAAIPKLPGRSGQKILIKSFQNAGAPVDAVTAVQEAMDEFERLVETHAGDRETLEMMLSGLTKEGQVERDEAHRRLAFQGNSAIWGVQARVQIAAHFVAPTANVPGKLDMASISGLVDLRRLRHDAPWAVATMQSFSDDGTPREFGNWEPLDQSELNKSGLPVLRAFSTDPVPPMQVTKTQTGGRRYELIEGPVGNAGAVTCITGWMDRASVNMYQTPDDKIGEHLVFLCTPVEVIVQDLYVHRSMTFAHAPRALVYSQMPGGPVYPYVSRNQGVLPVAETMISLGTPPDLTTPEIPRYRQMVEMAASRLGHSMSDFVGFRMRLRYPPIPTTMVYTYNLPEQR